MGDSLARDLFKNTKSAVAWLLESRRQAYLGQPDDRKLFGLLRRFFKDEEEFRGLWSKPDTWRALLEEVADKGFGGEQLAEIGRMINADKSDLFDVLAYIAYALPPITR
jgi:hypothetical protein